MWALGYAASNHGDDGCHLCSFRCTNKRNPPTNQAKGTRSSSRQRGAWEMSSSSGRWFLTISLVHFSFVLRLCRQQKTGRSFPSWGMPFRMGKTSQAACTPKCSCRKRRPRVGFAVMARVHQSLNRPNRGACRSREQLRVVLKPLLFELLFGFRVHFRLVPSR